MGKEVERLLTAGPRALCFAQLTVERQSRVSGPFEWILVPVGGWLGGEAPKE